MTDLETLRGPLAIAAHRQINSDCGGATVFCVVLADGFIVECGSDGYSEKRATLLADAVNAFGPDRFNMRKADKAEAPTHGSDYEANSRLIAAAPDLLEALKAISRHIDSPKNFDAHINRLCDEAIAKATGSHPSPSKAKHVEAAQ